MLLSNLFSIEQNRELEREHVSDVHAAELFGFLKDKTIKMKFHVPSESVETRDEMCSQGGEIEISCRHKLSMLKYENRKTELQKRLK